jgi:hypothetical protein
MIYLKKELLHAYASSSLISVLCVITLWQSSNAWQGQSSVQDKFCSKQTQPLLQTDLPLHVHTRSCKKSDDIWSSNNISSRPNFPSFQPCSKGEPTAGFGICAFNHIFVLYEDLRTCCLNVSSLGGNLIKVESLTVANFTRNLFWLFCRTSHAHAKEDPFVVKAAFVLNRICPAQNFVLAKH